MARTYFVYILASDSRELYVGVTNDLWKRLEQHRSNLKRDAYTAKHGTKRLVYCEPTGDVRAAIHREKQIKGWTREKKLALIRTQNSAMKDLAPQLFGWRPAQFSVPRRRSE